MTDPVVPTKKGNVLYWVSDIDPNALAQAEQTAAMPLYPTKADVLDGLKYEAEKVMDPILRTWFGYDCAPHEVEHYAENAAVDLSWALQDAGLLVSPATSDVIAQLCANVDRLRDERDALRAEVERLRAVAEVTAEFLEGNLSEDEVVAALYALTATATEGAPR